MKNILTGLFIALMFILILFISLAIQSIIVYFVINLLLAVFSANFAITLIQALAIVLVKTLIFGK